MNSSIPNMNFKLLDCDWPETLVINGYIVIVSIVTSLTEVVKCS